MQEIQTLDNFQLLDLLAKYTADYTKMITDNNMGDEYDKCKLIIKAIHVEIGQRKNNGLTTSGEISTTSPPDFS